jgi:tetratricopeptide (TPR) repeat protein
VSTAAVLATLLIALPAVAFVVWPLLSRRQGGAAFLALPPDEREQLLERKRTALAALRELEFEHGAGHLSDADYAELRARYESEAAVVLTELDQLAAQPVAEAATVRPEAAAAPVRRGAGWRHPLALAAAAIAFLAFGIGIGVSLVKNSEPDRSAGMPGAAGMPGGAGAPVASLTPPGSGAAMPGGSGEAAGPGGPAREITPEVLQGMLQAARASLFEGRYNDAILAYQAILKRDPKNVDAMTHLGLIVAMGGHADQALETFNRALSLDPNYPPALLYRGQVLLEVKKDPSGAITSWEKFLKVTPAGEDRDRVAKMIEQARAQKK